jgi:hypothetical protein
MSNPCLICNQEIDPERILYLPETRLCVEHAGMIAKYGGEFILSSEPTKTSKAGGMKNNYGGVSTSQCVNLDAIRKLQEECKE